MLDVNICNFVNIQLVFDGISNSLGVMGKAQNPDLAGLDINFVDVLDIAGEGIDDALNI